MSRFHCFVFLIPFSLLVLAFQRQAEEGAQSMAFSDCNRAKEAFDRLVREPSSLKAREFYISISGDKTISCNKTEILDYIFGYLSIGRYKIIAIEMLDGDVYAARAAIKLLDFIENGGQKQSPRTALAATFIGESLSTLIRVNPCLFLRACYEEQGNPFLKKRGFPVGFVPSIMNEKNTRTSYELEMRRKALRLVDDPELRPVRDECLRMLDKEIRKHESDSPSYLEQKKRTIDDLKARINYVFAETLNRPSPDNMKMVLALFAEVQVGDSADLLLTLFPPYNAVSRSPESPLGLILHEARCGNEYAIEVGFSTLLYASHMDDFWANEIYRLISNLILMKPGVFIEKLARYRVLEASRPDTMPANVGPANFVDLICNYISHYDYPDALAERTILKRRIETLTALNMPEHKELIARCVGYIEKTLEEQKRTKS